MPPGVCEIRGQLALVPLRFRLAALATRALASRASGVGGYMLLRIVLVVVVLIVVVLAIAAMKPKTVQLEHSITIKAAPDKIFPLVNDFHNWISW